MRTKVLLLCVGFLVMVVVSGTPKTDHLTTDHGQTTATKPDHTDTDKSTITTTNNNSNSTSNGIATTPEVSNDNNATSPNTTTQANADDSNNTTTDDSTSTEGEDDDKLPEGMSESLADFVMDMLKGQFHNATRKTQGTPPASTASGTNATGTLPSSNSTVNGTGAEDNSVTEGGAGSNTTATAHSSTDEDEEKSTWGDDDWSSTENFPSSKEPFSKNGKANCNAEVDLDNYCIIGDLVNVYFHGDLTAKGLRSPIFNMDIVEHLKSCPRGEWCLGDELDVFRDMQQRFYHGPLCEESMWECIFDVMVQREKCPDKEFMFVVDSADLMCELFQEPPKEENQRRCFAHTLAALHVTYADFLASNMSDTKPETVASCEGYGYRMTKTYLCADSSCDDLFESRIAMEKFGRWGWFMDKVEKRVIQCDLSDKDTCGALKDKPTSTPRTWFGMTSESYWPALSSTPYSFYSDDYPDSNVQSGGSGMGLENSTENEDVSLMMALSVASAVGLLFMVLGLIFWRRSRRRNLLYYRGDGYGKLSADEGPLLPRSSD